MPTRWSSPSGPWTSTGGATKGSSRPTTRSFADAQLGYADIAYRPIHAADAHQDSRLIDAPEPAPLRFRMVHAGRRARAAHRQEGTAQNARHPGLDRPRPGGGRGADARRLPADRHPAPGRQRDRAHHLAPGPHRRAGPDQLAGHHGPRRAPGGGRAGGDRRLGLGVRHCAGPGVAAAARGARAPDGP